MEYQLLSSDIDNTLIDINTTSGTFTKVWNSYATMPKPLLCYNTGRLLDDTLKLIKNSVLPEPDYLICGVGTMIYDYKSGKLLKAFSQILEEGWDIDRVRDAISNLPYHIGFQPKKFQHAYKQSYYWENATNKELEAAEKELEQFGLDVNIVYSGNRFFDVLPKWANKGNALKWLLQHLQIPHEQVIVMGDSGNDNAMFEIPDIKGIVVSNVQEELYLTTKYLQVYHAERPCGDGVIEGLAFYGVLPDSAVSMLSVQDEDHTKLIEFLDQEKVSQAGSAEMELILTGYQKALDVIRYNITPLGFSACSLTHNESTGTDENYLSVWARDSAITILGTLSVDDPEIRKCQRDTFDTLLKHISPNGQIPSNVRIEDDAPDYSGVGGICSIDSGLWLVIAFYEYIKTTQDLDFLRKHIFNLQKVMDWLSAHDGNNDALLEIPEASDWTDLFGRSYNVLYDEILWYRANISFGRMLEKIGQSEQAGGYLRWSQVIKKEIILNFWPSTREKLFQSISFAEQQYTLGDAQYLIAQVTPFDYSWRCDVLGNVLAFLFDVVDTKSAISAFRFMWGVGVNEPYPVSNVYPVVHPGDPDWRSYYTVNLLNLPDHYHNGGVWPFVGGFWVQFINKLELHELALSELHKLAQLNKLGVSHEWEFNEWAHGKTGRPMGKIYQAWSAAQYIQACHSLKIIN